MCKNSMCFFANAVHVDEHLPAADLIPDFTILKRDAVFARREDARFHLMTTVQKRKIRKIIKITVYVNTKVCIKPV